MRRFNALIGLSIFGTLLAANAGAAVVNVHVVDFDFTTSATSGVHFNPTINLGDTVHWIWDSQFLHSSTSVAGIAESWNSGDHTGGATFDHTFTHAGTFWYYCDMHGFDLGNQTAGGMSGTVTVVPEPVSSAALLIGLGGLLARRRRKA